MALIEGPEVLSKDEFDKRVAAGAKTFAEIDPECWKFHQSQMRELKVKFIVLLFASTIIVVSFIVMLFKIN